MGSSTHPYDSKRLASGITRRVPMAANTLIHPGVLVGLSVLGYALAADAADTVVILGWSNDLYDNRTGSDAGGTAGDLFCEVEIGVGTMENKSGDTLGITDVGCPVFLSSTSGAGWYEVQKTAGASPLAGYLFGFEADSGLPLVDLRPPVSTGFLSIGTAAAVNVTATLTAAQITNSGRNHALITSTTAAAVTMTTPTAAEILAAVPGLGIGQAVDFHVQNLGGTNAITVAAGTNVTLAAGGGTVAANTGAHYRLLRTAAGTFTLYKVG